MFSQQACQSASRRKESAQHPASAQPHDMRFWLPPALMSPADESQAVLAAYLGAVTWKAVWREHQSAGGERAPNGTGAVSAADQEAIAAVLEDARRRRNSTGDPHSGARPKS